MSGKIRAVISRFSERLRADSEKAEEVLKNEPLVKDKLLRFSNHIESIVKKLKKILEYGKFSKNIGRSELEIQEYKYKEFVNQKNSFLNDLTNAADAIGSKQRLLKLTTSGINIIEDKNSISTVKLLKAALPTFDGNPS